jgi:hypothetical protein
MLGTSSLPPPLHPDVPETAQSSVVCPVFTSALNTLVTFAASETERVRPIPASHDSERSLHFSVHAVPVFERYHRLPVNFGTVGDFVGAAVGTDVDGPLVGAADGCDVLGAVVGAAEGAVGARVGAAVGA